MLQQFENLEQNNFVTTQAPHFVLPEKFLYLSSENCYFA